MQLPVSPLYTAAPQPAVRLQPARQPWIVGVVVEAVAGSARSAPSALALLAPAAHVVSPMNGNGTSRGAARKKSERGMPLRTEQATGQVAQGAAE